VYANQGRAQLGRQISQLENHGFFGLLVLDAFKAIYSKVAEAAGEIGLGNLVELELSQIVLYARFDARTEATAAPGAYS